MLPAGRPCCPQDEAQMLQMLRNGTLDALIFEDTFVRYQASVNCDMYVAGIPYKPYDDAFAFTNGTSLVRAL
ncbi:uncharacterized protein HaLaN_04379 [Haematococcus lacustris]|uniref:Solute-binding protein family 3/N-terminal domain-containing protein n=1 Tax=Haematococcus lacustris TaxID=44745 RepID=A0A699YIH0_HAELA|nr:uncharacterized protein HaLaN_04379 [Haematococcus lacustris]